MATPATPNKGAIAVLQSRPSTEPDELRFIADLGRSLHFSVHPNKVAQRITEALQSRLRSTVCLFASELDTFGLISRGASCDADDGEGSLRRPRFEKWLEFMPPQVGYVETDPTEFIAVGDHRAEYVSPLIIEGKVSGAIVVGFVDEGLPSDNCIRLVDAVTQLAAMSVNLSCHYGTTIDDSISQAREEHRKFTESVLDALPVSLYVVDRAYRIVTWNRNREDGEQGIPRDIALGRDIFDVLERYPKGRIKDEFERAFRTGKIERIEQQTQAEDGSARHWLVSKIPMKDAETGEVTHVISVGEDVTMRVDAVNAVNRAEKLAAVGRLAAGVVHEINNPLATIAACAEALEQRVEEGSFAGVESLDDLSEYLGLIKSEAFRCKAITTGLLDFSRIRATDRQSIDVGDVVRSAANLISHQRSGAPVLISESIDADLPRVLADAGQIQQAIIALATNAIDAMPDGGTLTFRAFHGHGRVTIEVEDNGSGIDPDNVSKIFEPFFTTKEVGKGTGLGLAVCYGIVSEHNGRLNVRTTAGKGTTFAISLPCGGSSKEK
jgi:two-component system, NtrC family, sensor kinase